MKPAIIRLFTVAAAFVLLCMIGYLVPATVWQDTGQLRADQREPRGLNLVCPDSCNKWYIYLDDYGYSDWLIYDFAPWVPPHEMLSGEWAAAIYYESIPTAPQAMWLTTEFICPYWITNSNFVVTTPMQYTSPPDESQVFSVINNGQVEIEILATMYCAQTPMGLIADPATGAYVVSDSCIMLQEYTIRNITSDPIHDLKFYQFLHGHPADEYNPSVLGVYDSDFYPFAEPGFPMSEAYRYDITQWRSRQYVGVGYTEYIGFGAWQSPIEYDLWHFRGHGGKPPDGLHVRVENNALTNTTSWGPDETAGAEMWVFNPLYPGEDTTITVLLSVAAYPGVIWVEGEFEPDPAYIYYKFAFNPITATVHAGNFGEQYTAEDVATVEVHGVPVTSMEVLDSYPGFEGSVLELEIPIAPFLDQFGAPLDTVVGFYNIKGEFTDSEQFAGIAEVGLIGKSSASGGKEWILPADEILLHGDVNASGDIDIDDVVRLISVIFSGGHISGPLMIGDCNCSHYVDIDDIIYLIDHIFSGGDFPCQN